MKKKIRADMMLRTWLRIAGLSSDVIEEILHIANDACKEPIPQSELKHAYLDCDAELRALWGGEYEQNLFAVGMLAQQLERQRPGFHAFLERLPQVGSNSKIIALLAKQIRQRELH